MTEVSHWADKPGQERGTGPPPHPSPGGLGREPARCQLPAPPQTYRLPSPHDQSPRGQLGRGLRRKGRRAGRGNTGASTPPGATFRVSGYQKEAARRSRGRKQRTRLRQRAGTARPAPRMRPLPLALPPSRPQRPLWAGGPGRWAGFRLANSRGLLRVPPQPPAFGLSGVAAIAVAVPFR